MSLFPYPLLRIRRKILSKTGISVGLACCTLGLNSVSLNAVPRKLLSESHSGAPSGVILPKNPPPILPEFGREFSAKGEHYVDLMALANGSIMKLSIKSPSSEMRGTLSCSILNADGSEKTQPTQIDKGFSSIVSFSVTRLNEEAFAAWVVKAPESATYKICGIRVKNDCHAEPLEYCFFKSRYGIFDLEVMPLANNNIMATWAEYNASFFQCRARGITITSSGVPLTEPFSTDGYASQSEASGAGSAQLKNGEILSMWFEFERQPIGKINFLYQVFNSSGIPTLEKAGRIQGPVDTQMSLGEVPYPPKLIKLPDGNAFAMWGLNGKVHGRIIRASDHSYATKDFVIGKILERDTERFDACPLGNDRVFAAWIYGGKGSEKSKVFGRVINVKNDTVYDQIQINNGKNEALYWTSVAAIDSSTIIVGWSSVHPDDARKDGSSHRILSFNSDASLSTMHTHDKRDLSSVDPKRAKRSVISGGADGNPHQETGSVILKSGIPNFDQLSSFRSTFSAVLQWGRQMLWRTNDNTPLAKTMQDISGAVEHDIGPLPFMIHELSKEHVGTHSPWNQSVHGTPTQRVNGTASLAKLLGMQPYN